MIKVFILFICVIAWVETGTCENGNAPLEGKALFQQHCLGCHDSVRAPHMFDVQMRYQQVLTDELSFVPRMVDFLLNPDENKALMKHAVKRFGLKSGVSVDERALQKIAVYIRNESFVPPCDVWQAGMKEARALRDIVMYHQQKKKIALMCMGESGLLDEDMGASSMMDMMKKLDIEVRLIDQALVKKDAVSIAVSARKIADHDPLKKSEMIKLIKVLRSEMVRFKQADKRVRDLAFELEKAAKNKDLDKVKQLQSAMKNECMACHTSFQARVAKILHGSVIVD